jgi:citrate lyase subunit beta/citryl-CoA lyase
MNSSLLFVPADSKRKFEKAMSSSANCLILDLEDSIAQEHKTAARQQVGGMLDHAQGLKPCFVRINPLNSSLAIEDLKAIMPHRPFGVVLPKCESKDDLIKLAHYLDVHENLLELPNGSTQILIIATETAESLFNMNQYAGITKRLFGITWGAEDLCTDIGAMKNRSDFRYHEPFRLARSLCLFASAQAKVMAFDTVFVEIQDLEQLRLEALEAKNDGFAGKMLIHPSHIDIVNSVFSHDPTELAWAQEVVKLFESNPNAGSLQLNGKMIDFPHLRLARKILKL